MEMRSVKIIPLLVFLIARVQGQSTNVTVMFNQSVYSVHEDAGPIQPILVISEPLPNDITIQITTNDGSAIGGVDYEPGPYSVTFLAGEMYASFNISIIDDNILELDETFVISINSSSLPAGVTAAASPVRATRGACIDSSQSACCDIINDDFFAEHPMDMCVSEGESVTFTCVVFISLNYSISMPAAVWFRDNVEVNKNTTDTNQTDTLSPPVYIEFTHTINNVNRSDNGSRYWCALTCCISDVATLTVEVVYNVNIATTPTGNNVPGPINAIEYNIGTVLNLTCMVNPTPPSDSEFSWSCSPGCLDDMEMEQTDDIEMEQTIVIEIEKMDSRMINCSVIIDGIKYSSESIIVQAAEATLVNFSAGMYSVTEDDGPVTPELVLSRSSSNEVTIEVYSMDGTATGGGMDYMSGPYSVTFPAATIRRKFDIAITNDATYEGIQNFMIGINSTSLPMDFRVDHPCRAMVTIMEDDPRPPIDSAGVTAASSVMILLMISMITIAI